jgi:hypothetical protein
MALVVLPSRASIAATFTAQTPAIFHFSVMKDIATDYRGSWVEAPSLVSYNNPYRVGWERFLSHVAIDAPMISDFTAGIRDVAFAEACHQSMADRTWVAFPSASGK